MLAGRVAREGLFPMQVQSTAEWDQYVGKGLDIRQRAEDLQWELGSLALNVETAYGESSLAKFADAIGSSYDALRDYRLVVSRFAVRPANLSFGVMKVISASDEREQLVERAASEHWTVRQARKEMAPPKVYGAKAAKPKQRRQMPSRIGYFNAVSDAIDRLEALSETASDEELLAYMPHDDKRALERAVTKATGFAERWGDLLSRPIDRRYIEESA